MVAAGAPLLQRGRATHPRHSALGPRPLNGRGCAPLLQVQRWVARMEQSGIREAGKRPPDFDPKGLHPGYRGWRMPTRRVAAGAPLLQGEMTLSPRHSALGPRSLNGRGCAPLLQVQRWVARMERSGIREAGKRPPDFGPKGLHPGYRGWRMPARRVAAGAPLLQGEVTLSPRHSALGPRPLNGRGCAPLLQVQRWVARMELSGIREAGKRPPDFGPKGLHPGYKEWRMPARRVAAEAPLLQRGRTTHPRHSALGPRPLSQACLRFSPSPSTFSTQRPQISG